MADPTRPINSRTFLDRENAVRPLYSFVLVVPIIITHLACSRAAPPSHLAPLPGNEIAITLIHLNDVYEITPVEQGRRGGLARVATVRRSLAATNPNTYAILAGDLLSPSALGTAVVDGERLAGRQMVAVLNAMGLDYATFGNHEFDLGEDDLLHRLTESEFTWFSSNVRDSRGSVLFGVAPYVIISASNGPQSARIGLIGVTMEGGGPVYVRFDDPLHAVREAVSVLRDSADVLIAVTHLTLEEDMALAEAVPELDLILGGHEHDNITVRRGDDFTPVFKADGNARSVFVHDLRIDPTTRSVQRASRFLPITDSIPEDSATSAEVRRWVDVGFAGFRQQGFDPEAVVAVVPVSLDGRETVVRTRTSRLTTLIADAMLREAAGTELAIFNSGSIRIDDVIPAGGLTQYDVIRILPFGGAVLSVEVTGRLLQRTLDQGVANRGSGGFLQTAEVVRDDRTGTWAVAGEPLAPDRAYRVAIIDFLVTGRETGLESLTLDNPELRLVERHRDIRMSVIDELQRRFGRGDAGRP
jgi:5'-nucleotidase